MDCGVASDFLCRFSAGLLQPSIDMSQWFGALRDTWANTSELFWRIVEFLLAHSEKIFGLAGFSFGVWRWWYTRERVLHKRLLEYLSEQDERLRDARSYVLDAIHRPGPKQQFADPLFAVRPLRRLLRQRRWDALFDFRRIEANAERNLDKALVEIEHRLAIAVGALTSLRAQMASAYLLKGAIASARASERRGTSERIDLDDKALIHFRTVLQVHDYERDVQAKEYEAHQLRKLGHWTEARIAYEQLEGLTAWIPDERTRDLILARGKRYCAQIAQAQTLWDHAKGLRETSISQVSHGLMMSSTGALAKRAPYSPFRAWEAIEQGECHYVGAFVCHHYRAVAQEPVQLSLAETTYKNVLNQTPLRWFMSRGAKRLRVAATAGLERVQRAQIGADYDTAWLLPPSNEPQEPSAPVSNSGSQ